jgi:hypothetical protein
MANPTTAELRAQLAALDQLINEPDATIIRLQQQIEKLGAKVGKPTSGGRRTP